MSLFFSFDEEGFGLQWHNTLGDAKAAAEKALDAERDEAPDGWSENVTTICYGKVVGRVVKTKDIPWVEHMEEQGEEPGEDYSPPFDDYLEYGLVDAP